MFYTRIPTVPYIQPKFNRIARYSPIIGIILGILQASIILILYKLKWPSETLPFFIISLHFWMTGGLHIDGLMDTADGISAGHEHSLKAMKDSSVGAGGVVALIINLFFQFAALIKLKKYYLFALPIAYFWGRYSQIIAIGNYPYINKKGSSAFHKLSWKGNLVESIPTIICLAIVFFIIIYYKFNSSLTIYLLLGTSLGIIPSIIIPKILALRLKGHTGDSYGATVILVETITLIILGFILPV